MILRVFFQLDCKYMFIFNKTSALCTKTSVLGIEFAVDVNFILRAKLEYKNKGENKIFVETS